MLRGIIYIVTANALTLVMNVITNFILPKYLSMESYAMLKTFSLYTTYIGVVHLGFVDGIYITYGGKNFSDIDRIALQEDVSTLRIFQVIMTAIFAGVAWVLKDKILLAFAFAIIPRNMASFFKMLFQATGKFRKYSMLLNVSTIFTFVVNILLIFFIKSDNFSFFLIGYLAVDFAVYFVIEYIMYRYSHKICLLTFKWYSLYENIKTGILVMFGNLFSFFLIGMDRWFIKMLMSVSAFAQYSFAASIENMLNLLVTPVTITLYNYFCVKRTVKDIKRIKTWLLIGGAVMIATLFPIKFIMEKYLMNYIKSISVLTLLFSAQYIGLIEKGIYINLYKAERKQKNYFLKLLVVIAAGFILNIFFYSFMHTQEAFAVGTWLSMLIWVIISSMDFPKLRFGLKEILFFIIVNMIFISCGIFCRSFIGGGIYLFFVIVLSLCFFYDSIREFSGVISKKEGR